MIKTVGRILILSILVTRLADAEDFEAYRLEYPYIEFTSEDLPLAYEQNENLDSDPDYGLFDSGFRAGLSSGFILSSFRMNDTDLEASEIALYIRMLGVGQAKRVSAIDAARLGKKIKLVSDCFGIDEAVFTGLVHAESTFQPKSAGENGYGLTQMTTNGVAEVNDQLGLRYGIGAVSEAIQSFHQVISTCIEPKLLDGNKWIDIWNRPVVIDQFKSTIEQVRLEIKTASKKASSLALSRSTFQKLYRTTPGLSKAFRGEMTEENTSLVYGAIHLKTLLAYHRSVTKGQLSPADVYRRALTKYNYHPIYKKGYANRVLNFASALRTLAQKTAVL